MIDMSSRLGKVMIQGGCFSQNESNYLNRNEIHTFSVILEFWRFLNEKVWIWFLPLPIIEMAGAFYMTGTF